MNNHDIIKTFLPKQLDIRQLNSLQSTLRKSNLIVYGEIHGIKENANVVYTLVKKLGVKRLAIEASPAVSNFINSVKTGSCDFSLVDEDLFNLSVLLHRPGEELENLTPDYLTDLLFDDIPYLKVAQAEHDAFAEALRSRGIEVLYLDQLVAEAINTDQLREQFVDEMLAASKQDSRRVTQTLRQFLLDLPTHAMIRKIMAGVRKDEITLPPDQHQQLHNMIEKNRYPFYLDPMPNLYFTRDPAAAIGNGLTINKMHWTARRRESLFMRYIIDHHPRFANRAPVWYNRTEKFSMEGGDELVLSNKVMAIG
jgi:arginine deiminase